MSGACWRAQSTQHLARARSFLFVPGDRPERLGKALASDADAVIVDLEDAVAPEAKAGARASLSALWAGLAAPERARLLVRINAAGSVWHQDDVQALPAWPGLGGLVLPKAECTQTLQGLAAACPGLPLLPLVETAAGVQGVQALAASAQVLRLVLGQVDLQLDLGLPTADSDAAWAPARWALLLASRCAGLASPVDGVTLAIHDAGAVLADARRSRQFGFTGKLCIHPAQLPALHQGLAPSPAELVWARRVLAAVTQVEHHGMGALQLNGRLIDAPVEAQARRLLALAGPAVGDA